MVAIIILNYNNALDTINCFVSVEKFNTTPCKYVIVDNGSNDNSVFQLNQYFLAYNFADYKKYDVGENLEGNASYISLVLTGENYGYAGGNNYGLKFIENDEEIDDILILNNDILFIQDILPQMLAFLDDDSKNIGIISPLLLKPDGKSIDYNCARKDVTWGQMIWLYMSHRKSIFNLNMKYKQRQYYLLQQPDLFSEEAFQIELPSGSCMLIKKELFKNIGYFDSNTFLYYEENILYNRISRKGLKNYLLPQLKCIHLGAQTTKKVKRSFFHDINSTKSGYYYMMKYRRDGNFFQKGVLFLFYHIFKLRLILRKQLIKNY